jgi:putative N-acetylmannosamine-6-phosphate epimerase
MTVDTERVARRALFERLVDHAAAAAARAAAGGARVEAVEDLRALRPG